MRRRSSRRRQQCLKKKKKNKRRDELAKNACSFPACRMQDKTARQTSKNRFPRPLHVKRARQKTLGILLERRRG
jgi:hypothetical protein